MQQMPSSAEACTSSAVGPLSPPMKRNALLGRRFAALQSPIQDSRRENEIVTDVDCGPVNGLPDALLRI